MFQSDFMFDILPFFVFAVFGIVIIAFIVIGLRELTGWARNNSQPVSSRHVRVMDKRTHVWGGRGNHSASTSYYITFEFEDGERQEFMVPGKFYGQIAQGDTGTLTYQGSRFHDFQRAQL